MRKRLFSDQLTAPYSMKLKIKHFVPENCWFFNYWYFLSDFCQSSHPSDSVHCNKLGFTSMVSQEIFHLFPLWEAREREGQVLFFVFRKTDKEWHINFMFISFPCLEWLNWLAGRVLPSVVVWRVFAAIAQLRETTVQHFVHLDRTPPAIAI